MACVTCTVTEIGQHCFGCGQIPCPWCADYEDPAGDNRPDLLCLDHLGEYEGLPVTELERALAEQMADRL